MTRTSGAGGRGGRAAPLSPDERRRAIIEAVVPKLLEKGGDLTTREIAEAAGIAEGTIFRVFEDKRELLHEACWHIMRPEGVHDWLGGIGTEGGLEETVRAIVTTMSEGVERMMWVLMTIRSLAVTTREDGLAVVRQPSFRRPPQEMFSETNRELISVLADKLRAFETDLSVSPETAAAIVRGMVQGCHLTPGMEGVPRPSRDELVAVLVAGLTRAEVPASDGRSTTGGTAR